MDMTRNSKQLVNEYCQRLHFQPPVYRCEPDHSGKNISFRCTLVVNNQSFSTSSTCKTKKLAEMEVADKACTALDIVKVNKNKSNNALPEQQRKQPIDRSKSKPYLTKGPDPGCIIVSHVEEVYQYLTDEFLATSFRSLLCSKAQEEQVAFPIYSSNLVEENGTKGWIGTVKFKDETYNCLGAFLSFIYQIFYFSLCRRECGRLLFK